MTIVTRFLVLAVTLLALAGASSAGGDAGDLHAFRYGARMNLLVPYDAARLVPSGPVIRLGGFAHAWSVSPDGSRLVVAQGIRRRDEPAALRFVDLVRSRVEGTVSLPGELRRVASTAWAGGRVLAVLTGSASTTVYSVDSERRTPVAVGEIPGTVVLGERTREGVVLLLATPGAIGPATVAVVDRRARVRTVVLDRITAGMTVSGSGEARRTTVQRPGLALSPSGNRAYVLGAHEPAAAIDLSTLSVRYAELRTVAARAKNGDGSVRAAAALPDGRIVVSGFDLGVPRSSSVRLVDPADWSSRVLHPTGVWFRVGGGIVFTHGLDGTGLRMWKPSGPATELFQGRSVGNVHVVGSRAFVTFFGAGQKAAVVELSTGRVVRQTVPAHLLVGAGQPIVGIG